MPTSILIYKDMALVKPEFHLFISLWFVLQSGLNVTLDDNTRVYLD